MSQQGRILTCIALYYQYTRDHALIIKHLAKIDGLAGLLRMRRDLSLARWPRNDSRYGMPTGIDETDMWWAATANNGTAVAFVSIATEMWRGFVECGAVLEEIASSGATPTPTPPAVIAQLRNVSAAMLRVAPPLLATIRRSMAMDVIATNVTRGPRCFPYVAGIRECGELPTPPVGPPTSRASEAWRTYSEMLFSGALEPATIAEILAWHQTQQGQGVVGSRLKVAPMRCEPVSLTLQVPFLGFGLGWFGWAGQIPALAPCGPHVTIC